MYIQYSSSYHKACTIRISDKFEILRSTNKLSILDTYVSNINIIYRAQLYTYYIHVNPFCAQHVFTTWNVIICAYPLHIVKLFS